MAITDTTSFKVYPKVPAFPDKKRLDDAYGIDIESFYTGIAYVDGDASGGGITIEMDFGTYLNERSSFLIISDILTLVPTQDHKIFTHTDRWENFKMQGDSNRSINIWASNGVIGSFEYCNSLGQNIIYLGKPNYDDADAGVLRFYCGTNTESSEYNVILQGFVLNSPLPSTSIYQVNPIK